MEETSSSPLVTIVSQAEAQAFGVQRYYALEAKSTLGQS